MGARIQSIIAEFVEAKAKVALEPKTVIELEVRYRQVSREAFESIVKNIHHVVKPSTAPLIELTLNAISESPEGNVIKTIEYLPSGGTKQTYRQKKQISSSAFNESPMGYNIKISSEKSIEPRTTLVGALIRIKARLSVMFKKWRLDLTAVNSHKIDQFMTKKLKTSFLSGFENQTPTDDVYARYLAALDYDNVSQYEVELEWVEAQPPTEQDFATIKELFALISDKYLDETAYQEEIAAIAHYIYPPAYAARFRDSNNRLKRLLSKAIALSKFQYYKEIFPPVGFFLTEKADGVRAAISVNGNRCRIMTEAGMYEYCPGAWRQGNITIADAEFVESNNCLYLFDCMVVDNHRVAHAGFSQRVQMLGTAQSIISSILDSCKNSGCSVLQTKSEKESIVAAGPTPSCKRKEFVQLERDTLESAIIGHTKITFDYQTDGLIFVQPDKDYSRTGHYKWKPYTQNTIDMVAVICPPELRGISPYKVKAGHDLYLLFVGVSQQIRQQLGLSIMDKYSRVWSTGKDEYFPIQFSPSANPFAYIYHHPVDHKDAQTMRNGRHIVELSRTADNSDWVFHRIRFDRTTQKNDYGNDYKVAETVYMNYVDPFEMRDLWVRADAYFETGVAGDDIYRAGKRLVRVATAELMRTHFAPAENQANETDVSRWLIDLACGRGADLGRYRVVKFNRVLCIDNDPEALADLVSRKYTPVSRMRGGGGDDDTPSSYLFAGTQHVNHNKLFDFPPGATSINVLCANLHMPPADLVQMTGRFGAYENSVGAIMCNLAIHYMCDTLEHMRGIVAYVAHMLEIGGKFMFITMDGAKIFELLADLKTGEVLEFKEGPIIKYALRKKYSGTKLLKTGQMIEVKLPFSDQMKSEPLCNIDELISECTRAGLELETSRTLDTFLDAMQAADIVMANKMTGADHAYKKLFRAVVVKKIAVVKLGGHTKIKKSTT